jgi:hypothetical protein
MTDMNRLLISGFVQRNQYNQAEVINGLIDTLGYFGVDREIKVVEVPKEVRVDVPVYVNPSNIYISGVGHTISGIEVFIDAGGQHISGKDVYINGNITIRDTVRTEYQDRIVDREVEKIVEKEVEVEVPVVVLTPVYSALSGTYLSGDSYYVSGVDLKISGNADYISGDMVYINGETIVRQTTRTEIREVEKIVEKDVIREVEKLVYVQGAVDPVAEEVNNRWPRGDILYAGRTLKWVDNSELGSISPLLAAVFNVSGVPNYLQQTPFDVKQFVRKDDALLKYMVNKYGLKKATDDETAHACQWWVIEGEVDNYMTTVTQSINSQVGLLITGTIPGEFQLMSVPPLNPLGKLALGTSSGLGKELDQKNGKKHRVLLYSSDREQEQHTQYAGRPTLGSYDYWLFPFESLYSGYGDCEDGAILVANLLINAGIPSYKVKVAAGLVGSGGGLFAEGTPHLWCIYLASDGQWRVLDWCNGESYDGKQKKKPLQLKLAKDDTTYGEIWFTFNDEYAWKQHDYN